MKPGISLRLLSLISCAVLTAAAAGCGTSENGGSSVPPPGSSGTVATTGETTTTATSGESTASTMASTSTTRKKTDPTKTKPVRTTTTARRATTTAPPAVEYPSKNKKSSIGFGMYGVAPDGGWTTTFDDFIQSDWCNTFFVGSDEATLTEALQKAKTHRSQIFASVGGTIWRHFGGTAKLIDRWQEELQKIVRIAKESGAYEAFAGFYMDEPLLGGVTHDDLLKATKYMREVSGNKRVFICFALSGIAPEEWTTETASPPITPETGRYITDAAFDVYGSYDKAVWTSRTKKMLDRLGNRSDVRVWYIPPVMNYGGKSTEQNSIEFLDGVLALLKEQKNPGGIMGYSYAVALSETDSIGNIGLGDLLKPGMKNGWFKLFDHIQSVGRDICSGKTFGK